MDYFKNKSVLDLSKLHDMAFFSTSKATKTTFYQSMRRIEKLYNKPLEGIQLSFIDNPKEFIEKIEDSKYSKNTELTTITNILKLLKMIDAPLITYNKWLTILKEKTAERTKKDDSILKQKLKVLMNWTDIKESINKNIHTYIDDKGVKIDLDTFQNFLILALFTIQIPVRISNYVNMKVVEDDTYIDDKSNFLVIDDNGYKFVFNKYRTSHIVGKKVLFITEPSLQYLIDKWLAKYNRESNNFLIISQKNKRPMNGKEIARSLHDATEDIFGSPLTVDNLRASYMKHIADLDPNFQDKLDIANILGYSTTDVLDKHN
jgi:hypothetical protein